jgi:hypothetical protein
VGKLTLGSNLLPRAKSFWGWFIKKSPAFIVLTSMTVVSVFGLGVGGTLAATGVIANPFAAGQEPVLEPDPSETTSDYAPGEIPENELFLPGPKGPGWKNGVFDGNDAEYQKKSVDLHKSGWTGISFLVNKDGYNLVARLPKNPNSSEVMCFLEVKINGNVSDYLGILGSYCGTEGNEYITSGVSSLSSRHNALAQWESSFCKGQTNTWTVRAHGWYTPTENSGTIPAGNVPDGARDCAEQPSQTPTTEPYPTPTAEASPTPTTEPFPTPTTEASPTPTTEPFPTPTSP